jgi:hypothetical protein
MDKNPAQTEALAEAFLQPTLLADIAEEIDHSQPREHYMPLSLPSAASLRPVSFNPIRARATQVGDDETIAATQGAAQLITNAIKIDGQLKGKVPADFDGDRTKTQTFMNAFDLFWMSNDKSSTMKTPYKCCTYFLGLINGPKVEDWINDQVIALREKVTCRSDPIGKGEESLWQDLRDAFANIYAFTGRIKQAKMDLAKLEMARDQIDEYIAKFENLLRKAEIPRQEVSVIDMFTNGLCKGVHTTILCQDKWPETLNQWQEAAHIEVRRLGIVKAALGERGNYHLSTRQSKWQAQAQRVLKPSKKQD